MHLGHSKLPATGFMALNDVLSAPKQFAIITVVFTLCVLMMTVMSNMINSPKMIFADEPTGALNRSSSDEVMNELLSLNRDGTTIMCVTHDPKVAAKCSRILYIVDGGIMGEKEMGHFDGGEKELRDRERELNNWLMEQGW